MVGTILLAGAILLGWSAATGFAQPRSRAPADAPVCSPVVEGLHFICGVVDPEDLARIPGTRWIIASGYDPGGGLIAGSGLKLVDADAKSFTTFYAGAAGPDNRYPQCGPPPPADLVTHGLYLRAAANGKYTLYAVVHRPRESVEIFSIDVQAGVPRSTWAGCLLLPQGLKGNAVAAFADGTVLVTVLNLRGAAAPSGPVGAVLRWKPGDRGFSVLPGTELPQDNGIELSKDENAFYVIGFGDATVYVFSRDDPSKPLRTIKAPGFVPDNLRWSGDLLVAAGPMYDEPACGGTRVEASKILGAAAHKPGGGCNRGYIAAALDPVAMTWKILAYGEPNPQIGIIATGLIVGNTLFIGAADTPGLAYRIRPGPPQSP